MVEKKLYRRTENSTTSELTIFPEFSVYKDIENLFSNCRNGQINEEVCLRHAKLKVQIALLLLICLHVIMFLRSPKEINYSIQKTLENCFPLINIIIFKKKCSLKNTVFRKPRKELGGTLHPSIQDSYIEKPFCMEGFYRRQFGLHVIFNDAAQR